MRLPPVIYLLLCALMGLPDVQAYGKAHSIPPQLHRRNRNHCYRMDASNLTKAGVLLDNDTLEEFHLNSTFSEFAELSSQAPDPDPIFDTPDWDPANMASANGPMLRSNWGWNHCSEKYRVKRAMREVLQLAQAALDYLETYGTSGPSYQRYFGKADLAQVQGIFRIPFQVKNAATGKFVGSPVTLDMLWIGK